LNDQANRLIALAEEQAMEVIATLMTENDSDLRLMRDVADRMRSRPLGIVAEDDRDLNILYAIKARMERRVRKIAAAKRTASRIASMAA
jgi:hypothetical protein